MTKDMINTIKSLPSAEIYIKAIKIYDDTRMKNIDIKSGFSQMANLMRTTPKGRQVIKEWYNGKLTMLSKQKRIERLTRIIPMIAKTVAKELSKRKPQLSDLGINKAIEQFTKYESSKNRYDMTQFSGEHITNLSKKGAYDKVNNVFHAMLEEQINPIKSLNLVKAILLKNHLGSELLEWKRWVKECKSKHLIISHLESERFGLEQHDYEFYLMHDLTKEKARRYARRDCRLEKRAVKYLEQSPKEHAFYVPRGWTEHYDTFMVNLEGVFISYILNYMKISVKLEQAKRDMKAENQRSDGYLTIYKIDEYHPTDSEDTEALIRAVRNFILIDLHGKPLDTCRGNIFRLVRDSGDPISKQTFDLIFDSLVKQHRIKFKVVHPQKD